MMLQSCSLPYSLKCSFVQKKEVVDPDSSGKPFKKDCTFSGVFEQDCISGAFKGAQYSYILVYTTVTAKLPNPFLQLRWRRHWQTELVPGSEGTRGLKSILRLILYQISGINLNFAIRESLHLLTKCVVLVLFTFKKTIIPQNMLIIFNHIFVACSFLVLVDMNKVLNVL